MICKLVFIAGWLALFGIYAFSNPDMVNPVEGQTKPNSKDAEGNSILGENSDGFAIATEFDLQESSNPIHCAIDGTFDEDRLVKCKACYFPYKACEGTDQTPAWMMLFLFGFIVNAIPIITTIIGCAAAGNPMGNAAKCAGLFACLNCIGSLCWIITACVFRFSVNGNAIAGTPVVNTAGLDQAGI